MLRNLPIATFIHGKPEAASEDKQFCAEESEGELNRHESCCSVAFEAARIMKEECCAHSPLIRYIIVGQTQCESRCHVIKLAGVVHVPEHTAQLPLTLVKPCSLILNNCELDWIHNNGVMDNCSVFLLISIAIQYALFSPLGKIIRVF